METSLALSVIAQRAPGVVPEVAVVLGSGWGALVEQVHDAVRIPYVELQGFPQSGVSGHQGELVLGSVGPRTVAVMAGRKHAYETGDVNAMGLPLKVLQALGCKLLVQTNAAGSLRKDLPAHSLVLLSDHLNLPQRSPLVGQDGPGRFVDMAQAYDPDLRAQARATAAALGITLQEAVYAWAFGPQFETPAEIRMMGLLGADVVGMSTVPETILARHLGLRVLALSMVTNMGAGLSDESLTHAHTLAQARQGSAQATQLLSSIIAQLSL
ncbi:MAG: purine-nucleoside phosphorylase [Burkholderiales bacterium PBB4]|nr:MAG: purine-nucleoside phosphorylase [Burkholderiales bacterium PBB4]